MTHALRAVARRDEIPPGRMKCVRVGRRAILVANVDGRFYAADDTCTHEDASLSGGALHGRLVRCPLHGSRFDLGTGEALEEPAEDPLRTYPVHLDGEVILIEVDGGV